MIMEQIIYFFNHLVDTNVDGSTRYLQAFVFIILPGLLAFFLIYVVMKYFRGSKVILITCCVILYVFSALLPFLLMVHSLIYIHQENLLGYVILFLCMLILVYTIMLQEYYPKYLYKTDADYLKAFPLPDGKTIVSNYSKPTQLLKLNLTYAFALIFLFGGFFIHVLSQKNSIISYIGYWMAVGSGFYWWIFLVIIRRFTKCPVCHRTVYGLKKIGNKNLVLAPIRRILMYHCFTCMYCFAHIKVGKRDIIKEKNLEIINMHQPDFTVRKRK